MLYKNDIVREQGQWSVLMVCKQGLWSVIYGPWAGPMLGTNGL